MLQRVMLATQSLTRVKVELIWQSKIMRDWRRVRHFITMFFCLCLALFIFFVWSNFWCCWIGRFNWYFYSLSLLQTGIVDIAKLCGHQRIVSCLEGGYGKWSRGKNGTTVLDRSLLAENVSAHVHALIGVQPLRARVASRTKRESATSSWKKCKMKDECSRGNQKVKEQCNKWQAATERQPRKHLNNVKCLHTTCK